MRTPAAGRWVAAAMAKSPDAFRTISEASSEVGVPQHVLRFWETKFSFIRPMKRAGGRRFYRRQDLEMLRGVRVLLHDQGYTIKGVQRLHKEEGMGRLVAAAGGETDVEQAQPPVGDQAAEIAHPPRVSDPAARARLTTVLVELETLKAQLDALLAGGPDPANS